MRRAQRYFFVSPPLRMRWLVAGSILWARRHGPVAAFYRASSHCVVLRPQRSASGRGGLREITYVYVTRTALAAWLGRWDRG